MKNILFLFICMFLLSAITKPQAVPKKVIVKTFDNSHQMDSKIPEEMKKFILEQYRNGYILVSADYEHNSYYASLASGIVVMEKY